MFIGCHRIASPATFASDFTHCWFNRWEIILDGFAVVFINVSMGMDTDEHVFFFVSMFKIYFAVQVNQWFKPEWFPTDDRDEEWES